MAIVSNTSPLLNLAIIDQLYLLEQQFPKILVPPAVREELMLDTELPGSRVLRQAMAGNWIQVVDVQQPNVSHALRFDLDRGEAEAIALALETGTHVILLDERDGRLAARLLGLRPIGVLGILLRAKSTGTLRSIRPLLEELKQHAGFFIAPALYQRLLELADET